MKFHVLTLFPEMVRDGLQTSIIGRAVANNFIEINTVDIRDFSADKHGKVDDYTYGGGAGMLMQAQPVYDAWKSVADKGVRTVYVTPQGHPFTQAYAAELAKEQELVFLCGHYEGIDSRVLDEVVTDYISIGDYVLTGGELPAMVMIDAVSRLVPGVLHNEESAQTESFHRNLLEYPQYSRPEVWHDKKVPDVLLSGNHKKINEWRLEQSIKLTRERRPDLFEGYLQTEECIQKLSKNKRHNIHMIDSLASGRGELLCREGYNLLVYDRAAELCMITVVDESMVEAFVNKIPKATKRIISSQAYVNPALQKKLGFWLVAECKNACYTQKNPLPVRHKDIRMEEKQYVLYDGQAVAMMGNRPWGAMDFLKVEESARRKGYGSSLEAYCINRRLEQDQIPYCQVPVDNEPAMKLQEKLGLYLSNESVWHLVRENVEN